MPSESQQPSSPSGRSKGKRLKTAFSHTGPYLFLILTLVAVSKLFQGLGGIDDFSSAFCYDLPYLCLIFAALLSMMRPGPWRVAIAVTPFIVVYAGLDLHYIFLQSVFKLEETSLLSEGFSVCPVWIRIGTFTIFFVWTISFFFFLKRRPRQFVVPLLLLALAAGPPIAAYRMPKQFLDMADTLGVSVLPWSDRWTAALMGRTVSLFLFAADKKKAMDELVLQPITDDPERDPAVLAGALREKRNIYILVPKENACGPITSLRGRNGPGRI